MKAPTALCLLARLSDPKLSGVAPGLRFGGVEGLPEADDTAFSCCGGTGRRLAEGEDVTRHCRLGTHLAEAKRVALRYRALNSSNGAAERVLFADLIAAYGRLPPGLLTRLAQIAQGKVQRGAMLEATAANLPWALALAAAWRFNLRTHLVVLGRTPASEVVPRPQDPAPKLIIVDATAGLWEPRLVDDFTSVVGYGYGAMTPVFMLLGASALTEQAPPKLAGFEPRRSAFNRRLTRVKARTALGWLPPECLSKACEVTDGFPRPPAQAD